MSGERESMFLTFFRSYFALCVLMIVQSNFETFLLANDALSNGKQLHACFIVFVGSTTTNSPPSSTPSPT
eukprot:CAMPEP_0117453294 /NCGR_PEP_ID=MMETSP0759-20121206/10134_1 /TAXON_ID=63605 /ORGANISM="Percolomonas cosmopolitus, Strain WS" /LENGTH=69 /DNA_ID=CAMNT_0005246291 /DNA_START=67 /DNA_END=273 /DNA_ORIENTATION=-